MQPQRFDVWLHAFRSNSSEPGAKAVSRVFNIPEPVAEGLLHALPRLVRREAPVLQAQRIVAALESIGGHAEMIACPLQPVPVVRVGEIAAAATAGTLLIESPAKHVGEVALELSATETLRLGTQELAAFGLTSDSVPPPASNAQPAPSLRAAALMQTVVAPDLTRTSVSFAEPALVHDVLAPQAPATAAPWSSLALQAAPASTPTSTTISELPPPVRMPSEDDPPLSGGQSFKILRDMNDFLTSMPSPTAPAAQLLGGLERVEIAADLDLDTGPARDAFAKLALPTADQLTAPSPLLRRPEQRARDPRRRSNSQFPRANSQFPSQLPPAAALASIHAPTDMPFLLESDRLHRPRLKAEAPAPRGSFWSAYPVLGFLLVLGGTTGVFVLGLLAVTR